MAVLSRKFVFRSVVGILVVGVIVFVAFYVAGEWTRRILPGLSGGLTSYSTSLSPTRLRFGNSSLGSVTLTLPRAYLVYASEIKKRNEGLNSFTIEVFMPDLSPWIIALKNPKVWPNDLVEKKNKIAHWPEAYTRVTVARRRQDTNLEGLLRDYASGAVKETEDSQMAVYRKSYPRTEYTEVVYAFKHLHAIATCPARFLYCEMKFATELHAVPVLISATIPSRGVFKVPDAYTRIIAFLSDTVSVSVE